MNSKQNDVDSSAIMVTELNDKNQDIISTVPGLVDANNKIKQIVEDIKVADQQQQIDVSGVRPKRDQERDQATTAALFLSKQIVALATVNDDAELEQRARYLITDFTPLSKSAFISACNVLGGIAQTHLTALTPYGVTAETLARYNGLVQNFETNQNTPQEAHRAVLQATDHLSDLFADLLKALSKMDKLVALLEFSNPDYFANYQAARNVVFHHGSLMVKGQVKANGLGLNGVHVQFMLNGKLVLEKLTGDAGGFYIKSIPEGTYTVSFTKIGYASQTITVYITYSDLVKIDLAMTSL